MKERKINLSDSSNTSGTNDLIRKLYSLKEEKKALDAKMKSIETDLKSIVKKTPNNEITTYTVVGGERVYLQAKFSKRAKNSVDKDILMREVGLESYAKVATVAQGAVTKNFGGNVLNKCIVEGWSESFSVTRIKK